MATSTWVPTRAGENRSHGRARLIEFLSGSTTLQPGTVLLTGTPPGVGMARKPPVFLKNGDKVTVEIEKIGSLVNPVVDEMV